MNKAQLVAAVADHLGEEFTRPQVRKAVDAVLSMISEGLRSTGRVQISRFGTFSTRRRRIPRSAGLSGGVQSGTPLGVEGAPAALELNGSPDRSGFIVGARSGSQESTPGSGGLDDATVPVVTFRASPELRAKVAPGAKSKRKRPARGYSVLSIHAEPATISPS
ncbi:MAG: HU family DNA-binding protein [Planctomycetes bacterium]|nr:HU family DNA-binding protein [Planctomycetota bacterium]